MVVVASPPVDTSGAQAHPVRAFIRSRVTPVVPWLLASMVLTAIVLMTEVAKLIGSTLTARGAVYSLSDVIGPLAFTQRGAWSAWLTADDPVAPLILAHTLIDLFLFVPGYLLLALGVVRGRRPAVVILVIVLVAEVAEAILLIATATAPALIGVLPTFAATASTAKWLALLALAIFCLVDPVQRGRITRWLRRAWGALFAQRIVAIAVLLFAVMSLLSGGLVLEQLPDIQRQWFGNATGAPDQAAINWAFTTYGLFALAALLITRQRSEVAWASARNALPARKPPLIWPWLILPIGAAVVGAILSRDGLVDVLPFVVFIGLPVLLVGISIALRLSPRDPNSRAISARVEKTKAARAVRTAGNGLSAALLTIAVLGLVKALAGPYFLSRMAYDDSTGLWPVEINTLPVVVIVAVLIGPLTMFLLGLLDWFLSSGAAPRFLEVALAPMVSEAQQDPPVADIVFKVLRVAVTVAAGCGLVVALLWPSAFVGLGAVGASVALVGCWTVVLANVSLWLGRRRPLEVFQVMNRRTDPLLALLVVVPLAVGMLGGAPALHAIQATAKDAPDPADRPDLAAAFGKWLPAAEAACPDSRAVPMVLLATEGGGIRAATWTVDVLARLTAHTCSAAAAFLSSGVSGGSVGLAVMAADGEKAVRNTNALGGAAAVSTAVTGLLGRDLIATTTGLRIPAVGGWKDRAAQMEDVWTRATPQLESAFDFESSPGTGYVILNSTAATIDCKVVISQIDLDGTSGPAPDGSAQCDRERDIALGATIDLHDYYGTCPLKLGWATAAMSSARFPVISPAGRVSAANLDEGCAGIDDLQLIDGGYIDNTGLGTIEGLAPELMKLVYEHNATEGVARYVVPIVVYLSNEPGSDVVQPPPTVKADFAIPLASKFTAPGGQLDAAARLARLSDAIDQVCPTDDRRCTTAVGLLRRDIPHGVALVAPATTPAIEVPLGWALSSISTTRLSTAVDRELERWTEGCENATDRDRQSYYATLGQLMCALEPPGD